MSVRTAIVLAGWLFTSFQTATLSHGLELYVSPNGNDQNPGTKRKPFNTIERAQETARKKIAAGLNEPITVFLRAGVYELSKPLAFGPQDSGTAAFPITYNSFPRESAILSGGHRISGWKKDGNGHWIAHLPDVKKGQWFFRQLIVNDQRAVRARWPDQDAELVVYSNWSIIRGLITKSDERQLTTATPMGLIGHLWTMASPGKPAFIEHARVFLDQPGEWFLDRESGNITHIAKEGEDPTTMTVVAPYLEQIIKITGTKGKPIRNLYFKGIHFEHTNFLLPSGGYSELQAAHFVSESIPKSSFSSAKTRPQPVSIECVYAEDIRFTRCRFAHFGASGIGFGPGCKNNAVIGCTIEEIGGNSVMVGWRGTGKLKADLRGSYDADWSDPDDTPTNNEIVNCHIRRCGTESRGAVGIFAAFSANTHIAHNLVHDMPYTGISIGFRWDTTTTSQAGNIVEYNHVYDVMKKLTDGGGIYTLGYQPGTILRSNHIHDVRRSTFAYGGAPNNGFFIDQGSKGLFFESNVVYATSGKALRFNMSRVNWHQWKRNNFGQEKPKGKNAEEIMSKAGPEASYR